MKQRIFVLWLPVAGCSSVAHPSPAMPSSVSIVSSSSLLLLLGPKAERLVRSCLSVSLFVLLQKATFRQRWTKILNEHLSNKTIKWQSSGI